MTLEIEIIDRIYHNIEAFCHVNNKDIKEYIVNSIIERYNLDRYGDLNEKVHKKENKDISSDKSDEAIISQKNELDLDNDCTDKIISNNDIVKNNGEQIKKTKRALKVK